MEPGTKSTLKNATWGAVGGATAAIIIGFAWGGWKTSGTTQMMTDEALMASRAAICVAQFMKDPNHQEKLDELKKLSSWDRNEYIEKGGWDKMPGQQEAVYNVSRACADGLELLMEK
jgi:hypothetical protein